MRVIVSTILCLVFVSTVVKDARSEPILFVCPDAQCDEGDRVDAGRNESFKFICEVTGGSGYPYVDWSSSSCVYNQGRLANKCACWPESPAKQNPAPIIECENDTQDEAFLQFVHRCSGS